MEVRSTIKTKERDNLVPILSLRSLSKSRFISVYVRYHIGYRFVEV